MHLPAGEEEASSSCLEESLEEVNYDPELEELLRMIEQDAMRFNKSYGNMKASIVKTFEPISESYLLERLIFIRLMTSGKLTMFGSATKFKITPYGKMRAEDEPFCILRKCFWDCNSCTGRGFVLNCIKVQVTVDFGSLVACNPLFLIAQRGMLDIIILQNVALENCGFRKSCLEVVFKIVQVAKTTTRFHV
ncbi:hypothetical protein P8452_30371 [Trifolium repens]|nr:hypothetical protein P8452_30371 [Trifolium repens]